MSGVRANARRGQPVAQLSILDRLLDSSPERPREVSTMALRERLHNALHRDMEFLLNARRPWKSPPPAMRELSVSPLRYGMPDVTAGAFNDRSQREAVRAEIEETLRRFEPRLEDIQVRLTGDASPLRGTLQLRIDAVLRLEPDAEPVAFDTTFDAATSNMTLREVRGS